MDIHAIILVAIVIGALFIETIAHEEFVTFPIQLHGHEGVIERELRVNILGSNLDYEILNFCEKHNILVSFCSTLRDTVINHAIKRKSKLQPVQLPNAHLQRYSVAVDAEKERIFDINEEHDFSGIAEAERIATERILRLWSSALKHRTTSVSVAFIHSYTLSNSLDSTRILRDILDQMHFYKLFDGVDFIVVLNYGDTVPINFQNEMSKRVNNIIFVQVFGSGVYFEIPTLRIVQSLSKHLVQLDTAHYYSPTGSSFSRSRILYVHTKGVSYSKVYPQIEDWRDMMLYFLVGKHSSCQHLLLSGEIDCIGANYRSEPRPILSGNYWWSTAAHLVALPVLQYAERGKYEAETWILERRGTRLFVPHTTSVNHAEQRYPALCYAGEDDRQSSSIVLPYANHRVLIAGGEPEPLLRDDVMCGGAKVIHAARRFWQLL